MDQLPLEFKQRMKKLLGEEYEAFLESYDNPRRPGLRLNVLKEGWERLNSSVLFDLAPIPWAPNGYYYDPQSRPGKHPFHECGVYYMQEPSAMAVAALSGIKPGMRVLDLCAAPGGKSTQLASMLMGEGLLISNEIHPARAKILSQNIERMGITNAIVTNETPQRLSERFPLFFETVIVDAPCSGEGMFRKEAEAIPNWSPENVAICAKRQADILDFAAEMTAAGGTLVYSTCTFAPQEDEMNVAQFVERHPDFEIADLPAVLGDTYMEKTGLSSGLSEITEPAMESLKGCIRLWPHKLEGEGHFVAVLKKQGEAYERRIPVAPPLKDKEALKLWKDFCREALSEQGEDRLSVKEGAKSASGKDAGLTLFGTELYRVPYAFDVRGLKVLRAGLHLGSIKKNRFEPSHSLALALGKNDVKCIAEISQIDNSSIDISDGRIASAYLRGESMQVEDCEEVIGKKGWCLITICGFSAGWGKISGGQIKNHYPKGLRKP